MSYQAESGVSSKPAIFNESDMLRRVADDRELVQMVVAAFLGDIGSRLVEIDTALTNRDLTAVRRLAHTVKGAASNVSADALVSTVRLIEAGAEQGDWQSVAERIEDLKRGVIGYRELLRVRGWLPNIEEKTP